MLQDCRVIIWMNDGKSGSWEPQILHKFNDVVWHVSWSITGNILAVSGGDNKVCHVSVSVSCVSGCVMCQWVCHVSVGVSCVCGCVMFQWVCHVSVGMSCVSGYVVCQWVCHVSVGMSCVNGYVMCLWVCHVSVGMSCVSGYIMCRRVREVSHVNKNSVSYLRYVMCQCDVRKISCEACNGSSQLQPHTCKTDRDKCYLKMVPPKIPTPRK